MNTIGVYLESCSVFQFKVPELSLVCRTSVDSIFYHSSEPRTERVALQLAPVESTDALQSSDNLGTLNWKTEHDSKYTPIVFTQDFRY